MEEKKIENKNEIEIYAKGKEHGQNRAKNHCRRCCRCSGVPPLLDQIPPLSSTTSSWSAPQTPDEACLLAKSATSLVARPTPPWLPLDPAGSCRGEKRESLAARWDRAWPPPPQPSLAHGVGAAVYWTDRKIFGIWSRFERQRM
jgi:hypothetical protein